jgi:nitroreductase/NAD-dependent dihydropyrimidine dehydrogenase PreA subunit
LDVEEELPMINIEQAKCIGCGQCVSDCVAGNIALSDGKAVCGGPCIFCGHCVAICPEGAVSIPEYDMADVEAFDAERFGLDIRKLLYTIKARRSIRHYTARPVESDKLNKILQAGRYTATGANRQGCRFVVVQDGLAAYKDLIWSGIEAAIANPGELPAELLDSLRRFADMRKQGTDYLFRNAPALIYIAADSAVDAGLAAQNMELAAVAQGLGMLYNGFLVYAASLNPAALEWLDVTDKPVQVCMLVGYPDVTYERTAPRREADVRWR